MVLIPEKEHRIFLARKKKTTALAAFAAQDGSFVL